MDNLNGIGVLGMTELDIDHMKVGGDHKGVVRRNMARLTATMALLNMDGLAQSANEAQERHEREMLDGQ